MSWLTFQNAVEAWFKDSTGLGVVMWMNRARNLAQPPYGVLQIISVRSVGIDEVTYETVPVGSDFATIPTVSGVREFTLSCHVHTRNQIPENDAISYLEKARLGLHRPVLIDALNAAGVAVLSHQGAIRIMDSVKDNRYESHGVLDIVFGVINTTTFSTDDGGYILRTEVSSEISGIKNSNENLDDEIFGVPV